MHGLFHLFKILPAPGISINFIGCGPAVFDTLKPFWYLYTIKRLYKGAQKNGGLRMRRGMVIIKLVMALLLLTAGAAVSAGHTRITGEELTKMINDGKSIVIVDVREDWLFKKGHIPGAINIPYEDDSQTRVLKELSPADRIVFVCHGGPM